MKKKEKIKIIEPLDVVTIKSKEKVEKTPVFPKMEILTKVPLPDGYVRVIVLKDYKGMEDDLYTGDVIDVPDRRFKSLSLRGLVKEYKGDLQPNKRR